MSLAALGLLGLAAGTIRTRVALVPGPGIVTVITPILGIRLILVPSLLTRFTGLADLMTALATIRGLPQLMLNWLSTMLNATWLGVAGLPCLEPGRVSRRRRVGTVSVFSFMMMTVTASVGIPAIMLIY